MIGIQGMLLFGGQKTLLPEQQKNDTAEVTLAWLRSYLSHESNPLYQPISHRRTGERAG
jgi:hypothetical protein